MSDIKYTWEDLELDVDMLYTQIKCGEWQPDLIIGILRGGAIPAIMLSHRFDVPVKLVEWSCRDSEIHDTISWDRVCATAFSKNILVVDDILDSGLTISQLKERAFDCPNMKYCSIFRNAESETKVDFWCETLFRSEDSRWVRFPWESN